MAPSKAATELAGKELLAYYKARVGKRNFKLTFSRRMPMGDANPRVLVCAIQMASRTSGQYVSKLQGRLS